MSLLIYVSNSPHSTVTVTFGHVKSRLMSLDDVPRPSFPWHVCMFQVLEILAMYVVFTLHNEARAIHFDWDKMFVSYKSSAHEASLSNPSKSSTS